MKISDDRGKISDLTGKRDISEISDSTGRYFFPCAAVLNLEKAFAEISSSNNGAAFFGGDSVGYLDLALGCSLPWFGALRAMFGVEVIDAAQAPLLAAWAERFGETDVAKEILPEPDQAVAYAKKIQAYRAASAKK